MSIKQHTGNMQEHRHIIFLVGMGSTKQNNISGIIINIRKGFFMRTIKYILLSLTPALQMEVGCSRIWGLTPTTQTQVGGTPHKPALPATQPRAPPTTPDP